MYADTHVPSSTFFCWLMASHCVTACINQGGPYSLTTPLGAISHVEKFGSVKNGANGYGFTIICKVSRKEFMWAVVLHMS